MCFLGVHEDDGTQQLAPLECLVSHVLSFPLYFSHISDFTSLCLGMLLYYYFLFLFNSVKQTAEQPKGKEECETNNKIQNGVCYVTFFKQCTVNVFVNLLFHFNFSIKDKYGFKSVISNSKKALFHSTSFYECSILPGL